VLSHQSDRLSTVQPQLAEGVGGKRNYKPLGFGHLGFDSTLTELGSQDQRARSSKGFGSPCCQRIQQGSPSCLRSKLYISTSKGDPAEALRPTEPSRRSYEKDEADKTSAMVQPKANTSIEALRMSAEGGGLEARFSVGAFASAPLAASVVSEFVKALL
jgi:hypothetical protein